METKEWSWEEFKPLFTKTEVFSHFSKIPPPTFISWRVWAPSSHIPRKQTAGLHSRLAGQYHLPPESGTYGTTIRGNYLACVLLCLLLATHLSSGQVCENFIGNMLMEDENHKSPHNIFSPTDWLRPQIYGPFMKKIFSPKPWMWFWSVLCLEFGQVSPPGCMANLSLQRFTALAAVFFWKLWRPLEQCLGEDQVWQSFTTGKSFGRFGNALWCQEWENMASTLEWHKSTHPPFLHNLTIQTFLQLLIYFCVCFCDHVPPAVSRVDFPTCRCPHPLRTWYRQNGCFKLLQLRDTKSLHTIYIYIYIQN